MTCDTPQLPQCDLTTGWKCWLGLNSCWGVAGTSGHGFELWSWFLFCPRGHQDSLDEGFGGLYVVLCFLPVSWSHLGGAQPGVLVIVVCNVVPKTPDSKTGSSLEAAQSHATGKQGLGDGQWGPRGRCSVCLLN